MSTLMLHKGCMRATFEDVAQFQPPEATRTYKAIGHAEFVELVKETAEGYGLTVKQERYGINPKGTQLFFVIDLTDGTPDYGFSIGGRNSYDKSMSAGLVAGARVFVCDNLALTGGFAFLRKHTGQWELETVLNQAMSTMPRTFENLTKNLERLKQEGMTHEEAAYWIMEAAEQRIIPSSDTIKVWQEWNKPSYEEFAQDQNQYRLLMAFTENEKRNQSVFCTQRAYTKYAQMFQLD